MVADSSRENYRGQIIQGFIDHVKEFELFLKIKGEKVKGFKKMMNWGVRTVVVTCSDKNF